MKKILKKIVPPVLVAKIQKYRKQLNNKVICPICNSKHQKFDSFGLVTRENARCPNCGALERHRLLWKYLEAKTNLLHSPQEIKLLHFAPERFFYEYFTHNENINYTPCDLLPQLYNFDDKKPIEKVDITKIPFQEDHFDVIICNHVLEHIEDDKTAMAELYRVMKRGGWGIFQVPIDYARKATYEDPSIIKPEERERAFGQNDHVRLYGKDYKERLEKVGFEVKEDNYVKTFSPEELYKFGFIPKELIYYCRK